MSVKIRWWLNMVSRIQNGENKWHFVEIGNRGNRVNSVKIRKNRKS